MKVIFNEFIFLELLDNHLVVIHLLSMIMNLLYNILVVCIMIQKHVRLVLVPPL